MRETIEPGDLVEATYTASGSGPTSEVESLQGHVIDVVDGAYIVRFGLTVPDTKFTNVRLVRKREDPLPGYFKRGTKVKWRVKLCNRNIINMDYMTVLVDQSQADVELVCKYSGPAHFMQSLRYFFPHPLDVEVDS